MKFKQPTPILRIFDEQKAKVFYLDYLEFKVDWEHRFAEGMPFYLQISKSDCVIHLSEHHGDGTPGTKLRIECDDVEVYQQLLKSKNYKYFNPSIEHPPWAEQEMRITDPFGNELVFFNTKR